MNELADEQSGAVSRQQALVGGLSPSAIKHLVTSGRWTRIHPGVYATFNGPLPHATRVWAALLHGGDDAVLSHHSAAFEQGLVVAAPPRVDVLVPATHRVTPQPGLLIHRTRHLPARRHPTRRPPQTRLEDTVLDLVDAARSTDDVVGWIARGTQQRLTTATRLRAREQLRPRLHHRALVRELLADVADGVESPMELRYARDVERAHGLPTARRGLAFVVAGRRRYRDVTYSDFGVSVELDGLAYHPFSSLDLDHARDNASLLQGVSVLRYGWGPIAGRPCTVAVEVGSLLGQRGWPGRLRPCSAGCAVRQAA